MIGGHLPESPARGWLLGGHAVEVQVGGSSVAVVVPPRRLVSIGVDDTLVQVRFDPVGRVDDGVVCGVLDVWANGREVRDA